MARGKWGKIIDSLPKYLGTEDKPGYQDRVNAVKTDIVAKVREETEMPPSATGLCNAYAEFYEKKEELEDAVSACNLQMEALRQLMVDQFEVEGIEGGLRFSLDTADKRVIRVQAEPYAQLVDPDANRQWVIETGLERSLRLPWQTLNAIMKKNLDAGQPEPPGVKAYAKYKVVFNRN